MAPLKSHTKQDKINELDPEDQPYSMNRANRRARRVRTPLAGYAGFNYGGVKHLIHLYAGRIKASS